MSVGKSDRQAVLARAAALARKLERLRTEEVEDGEEKTDRCDELVDAGEELVALMVAHPDIFPSPPIPPDVARAELADLREKNAIARKAEQEVAEATRRLEDAKRAFDAELNKIAGGDAKRELN